jgi:hypothetical protein
MTTEQIIAKHGNTSKSATTSTLENIGTLQSWLDSGAEILLTEAGEAIRNNGNGRFITTFHKSDKTKPVFIGLGNKIDVDAELLDVLELPLLSGISTIEGAGFGKPFIRIGIKSESNNRILNSNDIAAMVAAAKTKALEAAKELAKA